MSSINPLALDLLHNDSERVLDLKVVYLLFTQDLDYHVGNQFDLLLDPLDWFLNWSLFFLLLGLRFTFRLLRKIM